MPHTAHTSLATQVGLLGGTFNPPHNAHLALALAAQAQLGLQRVDLMPTGQPWQKISVQTPNLTPNQTPNSIAARPVLAPVHHRLAMCHLAINTQKANTMALGIEACETLRLGNTYTVDTLRWLKQQYPHTQFTLIIGADQAQRLDTWHEWRTVLSLCRLAIVARNGVPAQLPEHVAAHCADYAALKMPAMDCSSSAIRARIAARLSIAGMVPVAVERYIVKHSLYLAP